MALNGPLTAQFDTAYAYPYGSYGGLARPPFRAELSGIAGAPVLGVSSRAFVPWSSYLCGNFGIASQSERWPGAFTCQLG